uniref:N-acetyllactosaminide alpha-1,3-galactosyltransferase-like 1 n=1 Tax=Jaculus jaculus TaxID=51337 RepID=UPI001E1B19C3|nr:N-acetyllactosaminide alpha-1,3-galactosyltransferase-like 1 [Jaculus jaculus]
MPNDDEKVLQLSDWFDPTKRPDVITLTNWLAPIIWEGTYKRQVLERYYKQLNITIGLAVFSTGRFTDWYFEEFLESADKHFMVGYNVIFYIFTDDINSLPTINLSPLRTYKLFNLINYGTWPSIIIRNMENFQMVLIEHIQYEVDFVFTMDINQIFQSDFGVETLGSSVAQLHAWWYFQKPSHLPYERRTESAAFIPFGQGDFYYHSAILGGTPHYVLAFTTHYLLGFAHDIENDLNSPYESHLNKYLFVNKPTKLLSPEYNWDPKFKTPPQIRYVKIAFQPQMKW